MVFVPLIFFSYILYSIVKRHGFDISACITLMYVIISLFSAFLGNYDHVFPYGNYSEVEIGIIPTFVYCMTIGLGIYPFYLFNSNKKRTLKIIRNTRYLDVVVYSYLFVFVFLIIVFWKDILFRMAYGDMGELRQMQYAGILPNAMDTKGGLVRFVGGIFTIIGDGAYFLIPCFFYSLCILGKSQLYNFFILIGSVTPVLLGFIDIDRSKTAFWILLFILSYFMFKPYIVKKEQKRVLRKMAFFVVGMMVLYLAVVTISRFGERDDGASGGLLVYLGQPFINFCEIWDKIDTNHFFVARVLPLTTFAIDGYSGIKGVEDFIEVSGNSGLHLNVFHTYIGTFLVDMGHVATIIIPLFFFFITNKVLGMYNNRTTISLATLIVVFAFGAILQCGIIVYFYTTVPRALAFWFFLWYSSRFYK